MTPYDAALNGAREIVGPVIAMTITLAAVYAPIGFVTGLTGALFREFAFTLAGSVVVSGFIALTLSPMMCSRLLRAAAARGPAASCNSSTACSTGCARATSGGCAKRCNFRAMTMLVLVGVLALTAVMYLSTPKELAPEEDQGVLLTLVKTPQCGNLDYLERATDKLWEITKTVNEKPRISSSSTASTACIRALRGILLKPWEQRNRSAEGSARRSLRRNSRRSPRARSSRSRRRPCPARPAGRRCSS